MQCANPADCPNAVSVEGITIKAADFAKCSFTNPDEKTNPLNPTTIVAGTDIRVRCDWDKVSLEYGAIQKWEQGMDGITMTGEQMKKIRSEGYPNNSHIKTYPFSCLAGMGRQEPVKDSAKMNWKYVILICDQQFNGTGTYHTLAMTFKLVKKLTRRRLAEDDTNKAGAEGTFGYNMRSGKCIKKDKDDKSCGDATGAGGGAAKTGEFALLFSLLALFALY